MQEKNTRKDFKVGQNTFQKGTWGAQPVVMCLDHSLQELEENVRNESFFPSAGEGTTETNGWQLKLDKIKLETGHQVFNGEGE